MTLVARDLTASSSNIASPQPVAVPAEKTLYRSVFKRALDLVLIALAMPIWVPVIAIGAALVALDGHGPFYRQARIGRDGKGFNLWKLRTMVIDADAKLESYLAANPEARAEWDAHQKLIRDPRVTPVGRIFRKTSLDELPQLINVLTGDMSLVGPRPMMTSQQALYPGKSYYDLRPGLTGPWQVSDRHASRFEDRARFDDTYSQTMSLKTDLGIMVRTVLVVLRGAGV